MKAIRVFAALAAGLMISLAGCKQGRGDIPDPLPDVNDPEFVQKVLDRIEPQYDVEYGKKITIAPELEAIKDKVSCKWYLRDVLDDGLVEVANTPSYTFDLDTLWYLRYRVEVKYGSKVAKKDFRIYSWIKADTVYNSLDDHGFSTLIIDDLKWDEYGKCLQVIPLAPKDWSKRYGDSEAYLQGLDTLTKDPYPLGGYDQGRYRHANIVYDRWKGESKHLARLKLGSWNSWYGGNKRPIQSYAVKIVWEKQTKTFWFTYVPPLYERAWDGILASEFGDRKRASSPELRTKSLKVTVMEYMPAPGQFVNDIPKYESGDDAATMARKAGDLLNANQIITLGAWGGYVMVRLNDPINRDPNYSELRVLGNAFGALDNPRPDAPFGGSCEPGIIQVSKDVNGDKKPNDEWYTIQGSGNKSAEKEPWYSFIDEKETKTYEDYVVTYHRPTSEPTGNVPNYLKWTDNRKGTGYIPKNEWHKQSYFPLWIKGDTKVYKGIRLANNGIDEKKNGKYYVLYAFRGGYADNYPNEDPRSAIDLDKAVDKNGNPVKLDKIDFVRVYTGVLQVNGWLGENSTEVKGFQDVTGENIPGAQY